MKETDHDISFGGKIIGGADEDVDSTDPKKNIAWEALQPRLPDGVGDWILYLLIWAALIYTIVSVGYYGY